MKILFLTLSSFNSFQDKGIYSDLMRKFIKEGHRVYVVSPYERKLKLSTKLIEEEGNFILRVKTFNIQKTNIIEKGIGTIMIEYQFQTAINKYFKGVKFDLVLYSTPPITFNGLVKKIKKRDNAQTYLLLKDIFPQNAVDLNIIKREGIIHRYFRSKEISLYEISDRIGCMSPANVDYLCDNNQQIDRRKVHVNPNSIEIVKDIRTYSNQEVIRRKYDIPLNSTVIIYGGNIGKPQGIDFLLDVFELYKQNKQVFFIIAGSGTEYSKVEKWLIKNNPTNVLLLPHLPKQEYVELLSISDIGLILLDPRFTIPNFPSRILDYLEYSIPVIAATDINTDIGKVALENGFGYWCENGDTALISKYIDDLASNSEIRTKMGDNGYNYLFSHYSVDISYATIVNSFIDKHNMFV